MSFEAQGPLYRWLACLLLLCTPTVSLHAADDVTLEARPATCIALHKGQDCFRRIRLAWSNLEEAEQYCLMIDGDDTPMICWAGNALIEHTHQYTSSRAERYVLVRGEQREPIADALVQTAWVYRSSRRGANGWRLF